jgi:hypothetical protein
MTVLSKKTVSSSVRSWTWKRRMTSLKPWTTRRPLTWCLQMDQHSQQPAAAVVVVV